MNPPFRSRKMQANNFRFRFLFSNWNISV